MHPFFSSQFNYTPVIWMFQIWALNNKKNRLHESCLHITYNDKSINFKERLEKDYFIFIHYRNIQPPTIEIYKIVNIMSSEVVSKIFQTWAEFHFTLLQ